jgi:hypothetical protein
MSTFLDEEERWEISLAEGQEQSYHRDGIRLYERWIPKLSGEELTRARYALAQLRLEYGKDQKEVYGNHLDAMELFRKNLADLAVDDRLYAMTLYHLAYAHQMLRQRAQAAGLFAKATEHPNLPVDVKIKAFYQLATLSLQDGMIEDAKRHTSLGRALDRRGKYQTQYEWLMLFIEEQAQSESLANGRPQAERVVLVENASDGQLGRLTQVTTDPDHLLQDLTEQAEHYVVDFYQMFGRVQLLSSEADGDVFLQFWQAKLLLGLCHAGELTTEQVKQWINDHHTKIDSSRVRSKVNELNALLSNVGIENAKIQYDFRAKRYKWFGPPFAVLTRMGHLM